jgi:hypothetical protein
MAGEASQQRRILEETYQYLKALAANAGAPSGWGSVDPATGEIVAEDRDPAFGNHPEANSQQVLQALLQEMQYLRSQTLQPLRTEVVALQQQREQLLNEVRQLEMQRLQAAQPPANTLPPPLVDELVERLREALLNQLRPQFQGPQVGESPYGDGDVPVLGAGSDLPQLHPQQRLEQLRHIQSQTDYMLLKLDTNLRAVFESMEQSIQSYRDSLHQGLDTMHGLGQQGEVIFKTLVNHLAQQLGQEQAAYLDAAVTSIPRQPHLAAPLEPDQPLTSTVDRPDGDALAAPSETNADQRGQATDERDDLELSIDLEDLELGEALPGDEDITLFQLDEEITQLQLDSDAEPTDQFGDSVLEENEATLVQTEPLPWPGFAQQPPANRGADDVLGVGNAGEEDSHTEIDALYESLFGEADEPAPVEASDDDVALVTPESPIDQALFETDTDRMVTSTAEIAAPVEPSADLSLSESDSESDTEDVAVGEAEESPPPAEGDSTVEPRNQALSLDALDSGLGLFEMPTEIAEALPAPSTDSLNASLTLSDLLGPDESPDIPSSQPVEAALAANTIESLAELLPAAGDAATPLFEETAPDFAVDEDSFISASSDEDLLSNPPGATPWDPALKLTADALDQLSADLSNLEGTEDSARPQPPTSPSAEVALEADLETFDLEALAPDLTPPDGPSPAQPLSRAPDDAPFESALELDWPSSAEPEPASSELSQDSAEEPIDIGLIPEDGPEEGANDMAFAAPLELEAFSIDESANSDAAVHRDDDTPIAEAEDINDLLAAWTTEANPPESSDRPPDDDTEPAITALEDFADDLFVDPDSSAPANPEPRPLGDEIFSLALEDVSFELDLPSVAKSYVTEEPESPADTAAPDPQPEPGSIEDISLATFEGELGQAPDAEPESFETFSFGDPDHGADALSLGDSFEDRAAGLDSLENLFSGEAEPDDAEPDSFETFSLGDDEPDPSEMTPTVTLEESPPETKTLDALEDFSLGDAGGDDATDLERFSLGDIDLNLNLDLDPDLLFEPPPTLDEGLFADREDPQLDESEQGSTITTLESLNELDLLAPEEATEPLPNPPVDPGIDLFGDGGQTPSANRAVTGDSTATIPLSLDSSDLFANNGASAPDEVLELFSEELSGDSQLADGHDQDPIELFPKDEAAPKTTAELDLADPGLLDLFPPLPSQAPLSTSEDLFDQGDEADQTSADPEAVESADDLMAEQLASPPLTLDQLLSLEEPEPSLPEASADAALAGAPEEAAPDGLAPDLFGAEDELDDEPAAPDLSLNALGLGADHNDILSSLQLDAAAIAAPVDIPADIPTDHSSQLVAQAQSDLAPNAPQTPPEAPPPEPEQDWFLGIDFGTTGISAVLMNRFDGQAYPLYWTDTGIASTTAETLFRLPAVAVLHHSDEGGTHWNLGATGPGALTLNWQGDAAAGSRLATQLKAWLAVGIPCQGEQGENQPRLKWAEQDQLPLQQVVAATHALLSTLSQIKGGEMLPIGAAGLEGRRLQRVLQQLQGVVVGHSTLGSDTYRINLREVILGTQLVSSASQVLFVEEAIAAVLSGLPDPSIPLEPQGNQTQTLYQCQWQGGTVVINAGASSTDLGIVNLPSPLNALSREDFTLRSLAYGGDALDLDIICQLLMPKDRRQTRAAGSKSPQRSGWDWQAASPEVQNSRWETLELEALDLPRLAEPDVAARIPLRQRLESSPLGQSLLEAARHGKLILQNQAQFHLELGDQSWRVLRRDLESRILVPYIQRINQHLNALMSETGLSSQGIHQVICTGGNASFGSIARWLRQKFPNATIIQDTYPSNRPPSCSRVAYGLVNLCRYPQVLDGPRHQYSDYFLLQELLRVMPDQPMPLQGIMHLLDQQGVNTEVCHPRILALLEGHLPPGLVPDMAGRSHLSASSLGSDPYRTLMTEVLFKRQSGQIYAPNVDACRWMASHLNTLMADKHQSLAEPLLAQLVAP